MDKQLRRNIQTDLGAYFQALIGVLMTATFVTLVLIMLSVYYGKDEKEEE
jgi:hypothetical protein